MLTFKTIASQTGQPTFQVWAGANFLGITTHVAELRPMAWRATAADRTQFAAGSRAKIGQKLAIHAAMGARK